MAEGTFRTEMHLRQPVFTYSACELFTKSKIKIYKEAGESSYTCMNELYKVYFQHDMTYRDFIQSDLSRRATSYKALSDKIFGVTSNPKYNGCERVSGLHRWSTNFLMRRLDILVFIQENESLKITTQPLNCINSLIENFEGGRYTYLIEIAYRDSSDLADMHLI